MKYQKNIQNNLREARKSVGMTQTQVAELLGCKYPDRVCDWKKGRGTPSLFNLFELCRIYKKLPHELYPLPNTEENN